MRTRTPAIACVLVVLSALVALPRGAAAQSPWYVTGSVGALLRPDASRSTTFNGTVEKPVAFPIPPFVFFVPTRTSGPGTSTATFDPGVFVDVGVGYRLPLGFRVEADLAYAHYRQNSVNPLSTDGTFPQLNGSRLTLLSGGGRDQYEAAALGFYDLPVSWPLVPYVGAGIGGANLVAEDGTFAGATGTPKFLVRGGSATCLTMIAEVGVTVALDDRWAVVPSYRFEHLFVPGNGLSDNGNIFKLGIRYSF
jgi:opacity protein-like surface antigen